MTTITTTASTIPAITPAITDPSCTATAAEIIHQSFVHHLHIVCHSLKNPLYCLVPMKLS